MKGKACKQMKKKMKAEKKSYAKHEAKEKKLIGKLDKMHSGKKKRK